MITGLRFFKGRGLQKAISILLTLIFFVSPLLTAYAESPEGREPSAGEWNDLSSLGYPEHLQMLDSGRGISSNGRFLVAYKIIVDADMDVSSFMRQGLTEPAPFPFSTMLYLVDRKTGEVEPVTQTVSGVTAGMSHKASISGDGRFVVYESDDPNLVGAGSTPYPCIYLYDRDNKTTKRISAPQGGEPNGGSLNAVISEDGSVIAFESNASNLVEGDDNEAGDIFLYHMETGQLELISKSRLITVTDEVYGPPPGRGEDSKEPSISADGRYIAFASNNSTFAENDDNGASDIFLFDRSTHEIQLISIGKNGEMANSDSQEPYISGNGQVIAFTSYADNLVVDGVEVTDNQIYVYSRDKQQMILASKNAFGEPSNGYNQWPVLSPDGRYLLFHSQSDNLNPSDINDFPDIYLYDLQQKQLDWVTEPTTEHELSGSLGAAAFGADGRSIIFSALSYMEMPGQNEPMPYMGLFVRSRESDVPSWPQGSGLTATKLQPEGLKLTWDHAHPEGLIGYQVFNGEQYLGYVDASQNSITLDHVGAGAAQYQVYAVQETYNRKSGPTLRYSGEDQQPPAWPQDKRSFLAEVVTPSQALLRWDDAVDNIGVHKYQVIDKSTGKVMGETQDTRIQLDLEADHSYQLVLKAIDQAGQVSPEGLEYSFATPSAASDGGSLNAKVISGEAAELTWSKGAQQATPARYEVWRGKGAEKLTLLQSIDGKLNTYVDSSLQPLTGYRYEVKGVDAAGKEMIHTNQVQLMTRSATDSKLTWNVAKNTAKYVIPGEVLHIVLTSEPGRQAEAVIQYDTWFDEQGQKLPEVRRSQHKVTLTEDGQKPGTYHGTFQVEYGITQMISLEAQVKSANGQSHAVQAAGWPLKVAGDLIVKLSSNVPDLIKKGQLHVWSADERYGQSIPVSGPGEYQVKGLVPSDDYTIRLFDERGKLLDQRDEATVVAGLENEFSFDLAIPAELFVKVNGLGDYENEGVKLTFTDKDSKAFLDEGRSTQSGAHLSGKEFIGKNVGIKTDIGDLPFRSVPEQTVTLSAGKTQHTINLEPIPQGTLTGKVTDPSGKPIAGADISVSQHVDGRDFTFTAKTNEQGVYSVEAMAGGARVDAAYLAKLPYAYTKETSTVQIPANLDLTVHYAGEGKITGTAYFKYLNSAWDGPFELDWSNAAKLNYEVIYKGRTNVSGGFPIKVHGFAGDPVTVCAFAKTFPRVCQDVILDNELNAHAEFRLEEKGGRIQGRVLSADGQEIPYIQYELYRVNAQGGFELIESYNGRSHLDLGIQEPGEYRLKAETDGKYAELPFTLSEGEIKELGDITLRTSGVFAGQDGSTFTATPKEQIAGGLVRLRATITHRNNGDINQVRLKLEIPKGAVLVEGTLQMDGQAIPGAAVRGNWIEVPVGTLPSWESRAVTYQVKLPNPLPQEKLSATGRVEFQLDGNTVEETLGTAALETPGLSLETPERLSVRKAVLSGRAPANEQVRVYEGRLQLGTATASPGGFWRMEVSLPDYGDPNMYVLHAEAGTGESRLQTAEAFVYYDSNQPKLLEMTLQQMPYGKKVTLDIEKGVARFPYTVTPSPDFEITLKFSDPQAVDHVQVYLDGQDGDPVQAQLKADNLYYAHIQTSSGTLGGIYVDFDQKQPSIQDQWKKPIPTDAELRKMLPRGMRDFQAGSVDKLDPDNGKYNGSMDFTLPQYPGVKMSISMAYDLETDYQPTPEEQQSAEESGLPFYSPVFDMTETGGKVQANMEWYVPMEYLQKNNLNLRVAKAAASSTWQYAKITAQYVGEKTGDAYTYNDMTSMPTNYLNYSKKITTIMDSAFDFDCPENMDGQFGKEFAKTMIFTVGGEVVKNAVSIAGSYLSPSSFTGTFALNQGNNMFGNYIDSQVDKQINKFQQVKGKCDKETEKEKRRQQIRDAKKKKLHPVWIYDPSGYVYEGLYSERVEDAKATVIYQDPDTQEWLPWNADWFGQTNPQTTDVLGAYGWDVPPGLWQVVVERDGYETSRSDVLTVPPPHMDVRIGLMSFHPPQVTQATAKTTAVEVKMSKPILISELNQETIKVFANEEETVNGTVTAATYEVSPLGVALTKSLKFVPEQPWQGGETLTVEVDPHSIISYSGIPMLSSYRVQKVVDKEPPSSDADLNSLAVSAGSLEPVFSPDKTEYKVKVPSGTTQLGVTAQTAKPDATMTVNGEVAISGEQKRVAISSNQQTITIVVTSAGGATKTYSLTVQREDVPSGSNSGGGSSKPHVTTPYELVTENGQTLAVYTVKKGQLEKLTVKDGQFILNSAWAKEAEGYRVSMDSQTWAWLNRESKANTLKWETPAGVLVLTLGASVSQGIELDFVKGPKGWTVQMFTLGEQGKRTSLTTLRSWMTLIFKHQEDGPFAVLRGMDPVPAFVTDGQVKVYTRSFGSFSVVKNVAAFKDISGHWAANDIQWMAERRFIRGMADGVFAPNGTVNRAQFVSFLARALGLSGARGASPVFTDVQTTDWFAADVYTLIEAGIIHGYKDGTFRPDQPITRQEMAVLIAQAAKYTGLPWLKSTDRSVAYLDDKEISNWAREAVRLMTKNGLMQGDDGQFAPGSPATRAQTAVTLKNMLRQLGLAN